MLERIIKEGQDHVLLFIAVWGDRDGFFVLQSSR